MVIISSFYSYLPDKIELEEDTKISLIGGNLGSRMINYDHFDTEIQLRYPEKKIRIRNLCDGGDTPGFRPHSGRFTPWAFPGAELYQTEFTTNSGSEGHFEYPDQWLTRMETDVIITFFGYSESFNGPSGLLKYKKELQAFLDHSKTQRYNGKNAPQVVMVSPIAFQDLSAKYDLPNAKKENANLLQYMLAMKEVATKNQILFIDAYTPSLQWYKQNKEPLTIDGFQLNEKGYKLLSVFLADQIFGKTAIKNENYRDTECDKWNA